MMRAIALLLVAVAAFMPKESVAYQGAESEFVCPVCLVELEVEPLPSDPAVLPSPEPKEDRGAVIERDLAWTNVAQLLLNFFGLVGLGFTVHFARQTWRAAQQQAEAAKASLETLERPYIFVRPPDHAYVAHNVSDAGGERRHSVGFSAAKIGLVNAGRAPALLTQMKLTSVIRKTSEGFDWLKPSKEVFAGELLMVPGGDQQIDLHESADIEVGLLDDFYSRKLTMVLMGEVVYKSPGGATYKRLFTWKWNGATFAVEQSGRNHDEPFALAA